MSNNSLLASAAIFRILYDSNKDIYDVISEFIRAYIILESKWAFTSTECVIGVNDSFGFNMPEAVIRSCLKNRLKKNGELEFTDGFFTVTNVFNKNNAIKSSIDSANKEFNDIASDLVEHARIHPFFNINNEKLLSCFRSYLLNKNIPENYSECIAHFILKRESERDFKEKLNRIEEGLILYSGIQYSPELSSLGRWRGNLVIYLDTEHLFSATGMNGVLYKQIFDDLYSLVREVNFAKGGKISFKYFLDTKEEVDSFFYAAEKIIENNSHIDPSKTAMINIVNGCDSKSDILEKKIKFDNDLSRMKINMEIFDDYYSEPQFNVESSSVLESLMEKYKGNHDLNSLSGILKKFTKINYFRKGVSKTSIDNISALFLTEKWLTQSVAFSEEVHDGKGFVPFATNIEFLTERLWFKLNKGFGENSTPHSFDVITKAKIVISSQLNGKVSQEYNKLNEKFKRGDIDKESTVLLIAELRQKSVNVDSLDLKHLEESISVFSNSFIETTLRQNDAMKLQLRKGAEAIEELRRVNASKRTIKLRPLKKKTNIAYFLMGLSIYFLVPIFIFIIFYWLRTPNDTPLSILFGAVTVLGTVAVYLRYKRINRFIRLCTFRYYRKLLNNSFSRTAD